MTPSALLLREPRQRKQAGPRRATRRQRTGESGRGIFCRTCQARLSQRAAVFPMKAAGASGIFVNPHGFLHEVLTVRRAQNVIAASAATAEFTWFPGYAWEIVFCSVCREHVGWRFTASDEREPAVFWGLRRAAIVEE